MIANLAKDDDEIQRVCKEIQRVGRASNVSAQQMLGFDRYGGYVKSIGERERSDFGWESSRVELGRKGHTW